MGKDESIQIKGYATQFEEVREGAILVGIERTRATDEHIWDCESSLAELARLADTAGADTLAYVTQRMDAPNARCFVGSGKAAEIAELAQTLEANVVIFDDELTPSQQANLEKIVGRDVKIIDRTALILDIFALHATSKEGRLQVRLAQNQYLLPRLRGMWAHLASNKMGGGVGSRFGEGESQLEIDRRIVRNRITSIKRELKHLAEVRATQREYRYSNGMFKVALAGYTNAGKSSLLNRLTDADVLSYDKLFATLDSTTRKFELPEGREITLTDTVGFIQKLPTTLVEAFKSTLDEITGADLVLQVCDASSPEYREQIEAVQEVLGQIDALKIPRLMVFNKCDAITAEERQTLQLFYPDAIYISALTGEGVDTLVEAIAQEAAKSSTSIRVCIPFDQGALVALAHERCRVLEEDYTDEGTVMLLDVGQAYVSRFEPYIVKGF